LVDLNEEVVSLGLLGSQVNVSLDLVGLSLDELRSLLLSDGVDLSNQKFVVFR